MRLHTNIWRNLYFCCKYWIIDLLIKEVVAYHFTAGDVQVVHTDLLRILHVQQRNNSISSENHNILRLQYTLNKKYFYKIYFHYNC